MCPLLVSAMVCTHTCASTAQVKPLTALTHTFLLPSGCHASRQSAAAAGAAAVGQWQRQQQRHSWRLPAARVPARGTPARPTFPRGLPAPGRPALPARLLDPKTSCRPSQLWGAHPGPLGHRSSRGPGPRRGRRRRCRPLLLLLLLAHLGLAVRAGVEGLGRAGPRVGRWHKQQHAILWWWRWWRRVWGCQHIGTK